MADVAAPLAERRDSGQSMDVRRVLRPGAGDRRYRAVDCGQDLREPAASTARSGSRPAAIANADKPVAREPVGTHDANANPNHRPGQPRRHWEHRSAHRLSSSRVPIGISLVSKANDSGAAPV